MPFADELARPFEVVPYRPEWPADFRTAAAVVRAAIADAAQRIDHIGSTAVPGLAAKDCIDIQVVVDDVAVVDAVQMAGAGFRLRPESWNRVETAEGRTWPKLVFAGPVGSRATNVHVRLRDSTTARRNLLFRDYLRADATARESWAAFKTLLAAECGDLAAYGRIKQPATEVLMIAAGAWADRTRWLSPLE